MKTSSIQHSISLLATPVRQAIPITFRTTLWLLRLMIPISFVVRLLQYEGLIDTIACLFRPLFQWIGLPGYSAIAFITTALNTTYAGLAVMLSLPLTMRQATILSIMMLICHALPIESAVNHKTGSSFLGMTLLRIIMAFVAAAFLHLVLPSMPQPFSQVRPDMADLTFAGMLQDWAIGMVFICLKVFLIIFTLMVIQQIIQIYHLIPRLSRPLRPLMAVFGLPREAAYLWLIGNILGISYGGAVMLDMQNKGEITREGANDVNYHLVMSHSLLEDTFVFASAGISIFWIISTRLLFAILVVWTRRLLKPCLKQFKWLHN